MKRIEASITLTLVIIISTILLVAGMTLAFVGIDLARTSSGFENHVVAETYLHSCFDEGMYLINKNKSFLGQVNITFDQGSCAAVVTDNVANTKNLNVNSQKGEYYSNKVFEIDVTSKPYKIIAVN